MKCRVWNVGGRTCNGSSAELQRGNHIGDRICQCRIDVFEAGYLRYLRCEHWNDDDRIACKYRSVQGCKTMADDLCWQKN